MSTRRRLLRAALVIACGAISIAATQGDGTDAYSPPGQRVPPAATMWQDFYQGCIGEAPGQAYTCACSATWMIGACDRTGDPEAVLTCVQGIQRGPSFARNMGAHCGQYGRMGTVAVPGAVRARARPAEHHLPAWAGGFEGCMRNATPAERRQSHSMEYTCACVTTYLINMCIAAPGATREAYQGCVQGHNADIQNAGRVCLRYGHLMVR